MSGYIGSNFPFKKSNTRELYSSKEKAASAIVSNSALPVTRGASLVPEFQTIRLASGQRPVVQPGLLNRGYEQLSGYIQGHRQQYNRNPMLGAIAFDTEFFDLKSGRVPVQIGVDAQVMNWLDTTEARIFDKSGMQNFVLGLSSEHAQEMREVARAIVNSGGTQDDYAKMRWLLTYKDMQVVDKRLGQVSGLLPQDQFKRLTTAQIRSYIQDGSVETAIKNLSSLQTGKNAVDPSAIAAQIGRLGQGLKGMDALVLNTVGTGAGDISLVQSALGRSLDELLPASSRRFTVDLMSAQAVVEGSAHTLIGRNIAAGLQDTGAVLSNNAITGRLLSQAGLAIPKYEHIAGSDAWISNIGLRMLLSQNLPAVETAKFKVGDRLTATGNFNATNRMLGDKVVAHGVYNSTGYQKIMAGDAALGKTEQSLSPMAYREMDSLILHDIRRTAAERADDDLYQVTLFNPIDDRYSVTVLKGTDAMETYFDAIRLAPQTKRATSKMQSRALAQRQAEARNAYQQMFSGASDGWFNFERNYGSYRAAYQKALSAAGDLNSDSVMGALKTLENPFRAYQLNDAQNIFLSTFKDSLGENLTPNQARYVQSLSSSFYAKSNLFEALYSRGTDVLAQAGEHGKYLKRSQLSLALKEALDGNPTFARAFSGKFREHRSSIYDLPVSGRMDFGSVQSAAQSIYRLANEPYKSTGKVGTGEMMLRLKAASRKLSRDGLLTAEQLAEMESRFGQVESMAGQTSGYANLQANLAELVHGNFTKNQNNYKSFHVTKGESRMMPNRASLNDSQVAGAITRFNEGLSAANKNTRVRLGRTNLFNQQYSVLQKSLAQSEIARRDMIAKIAPGSMANSVIAGQAESMVQDLMHSFEGRGIQAKVALGDAGQLSLHLSHGRGAGMSNAPLEALRNVATVNIPVLDPSKGTISFNNSILVNTGHLRLTNGKLSYRTAFDEMLSELSRADVQTSIAKALESGDVRLAQGRVDQLMTRTILSLGRFSGDSALSDAYRNASAMNPLSTALKKNRIDYSYLVQDYLGGLPVNDRPMKYTGASARPWEFSQLDFNKFGNYLLRSEEDLQKIVSGKGSTASLMAEERYLASHAINLRQIMAKQMGPENASKLLRYGYIRADQVLENYAPGFGPETMSLGGRVAVGSRSSQAQSFNTVGIGGFDTIMDYGRSPSLRLRNEVLGGFGRYDFNIGTQNAWQAYRQAGAIGSGGQITKGRGVNASALFVDNNFIRRLFDPEVIKGAGLDNLAVAAMPSIRDSSALYDTDFISGMQTVKTRSLSLDPGNVKRFYKELGIQNATDKFDGSMLQDRLIGSESGVMHWLRQKAGYTGSHASQIQQVKLLENGGLQLLMNEYTPATKLAGSEGEKLTGSSISKRTRTLVANEAYRQKRISRLERDSFISAEVVLQQEKKTQAGMSIALIQDYVREKRRQGVPLETIRQDLTRLMTNSAKDRQSMTGGATLSQGDWEKAITIAEGQIQVDNSLAMKNILNPVETARALGMQGSVLGYGGKFSAVRGTINVGVADLYDYGGVAEVRVNQQGYRTREMILQNILGDDADIRKTWLDPITRQIQSNADRVAPEFRAIRGDLQDLFTPGRLPKAGESVFLTGQNIDKVKAKLHDVSLYNLSEQVTRSFDQKKLAMATLSESELARTYYMLGLKPGQKAWVELPQAVSVPGLGPNGESMTVNYLPYTVTNIPKNRAGIWEPDDRQSSFFSIMKTIEDYNAEDPKVRLDDVAYQRRMQSQIVDYMVSGSNAVHYHKGSVAARGLTMTDPASAYFWAMPMNEMIDPIASGRMAQRSGVAGSEIERIAKGLQGLINQQGGASGADVALSSSAMRNILERTYQDATPGQINAMIDQMRGGFVGEVSRNPLKDMGTVSLAKVRVFSEAEEGAMARSMAESLDRDGLAQARARYNEVSKTQMYLAPDLAKAIKADYDGDAIALRLLGISSTRPELDDGAQEVLSRAANQMRRFRTEAIDRFGKDNPYIGDLVNELAGANTLLDRSGEQLSKVAEASAAYASTAKDYVGQLAKRSEELYSYWDTARAAATRVNDPTGKATVAAHADILSTYISALQESPIGAKKIEEHMLDGTMPKDPAVGQTMLETFQELSGRFERGQLTTQSKEWDDFVNLSDSIGLTKNHGIFPETDRIGAFGAQGLGEEVSLRKVAGSISFVRDFAPSASYGYGKDRVYDSASPEAKVRQIGDILNKSGSDESMMGQFVNRMRGESADLNLDIADQILRNKLTANNIVEDAAAEFSSRAGKYAAETIGGLGNIINNPNLGRVGMAAGVGLAGLMVLGAATAPKIDHTKDRSAVDRRMAADGDWISPDAFAGAPNGAAPDLGLPRAMLTQDGHGYNNVKISIRGRASGQSDDSMIKLIESEINRQVPVRFQFNYSSNDTREHMDQSWLSEKMAEALNNGYAR